MLRPCDCALSHQRRRVVVTGGPGAGKTAVLELVRRALCSHVVVLPEAAGIVFGGGFPRRADDAARRAAQRAIFHVQHELENVADADDSAIVLCDRGVVDGAAYWPGDEGYWRSVGMTRADAHARYAAVLHLRVPPDSNGYGHQNPLRLESASEARAIDERIQRAWEGHPRRHVIEATADFMTKARRAIEIIRDEMPACCRARITDGRVGHLVLPTKHEAAVHA